MTEQDFTFPIALIGGYLIAWLAYIIPLYCARKYEEREKKYEIAIGKYCKELNQKNMSIAIGQGKTADMRGEE